MPWPGITENPIADHTSKVAQAYANVHFPYPAKANGDRIFRRLLHLKLTSHFPDQGRTGFAVKVNTGWLYRIGGTPGGSVVAT